MADAGQFQATGPLFFLKTGCLNEVLVASANWATANFERWKNTYQSFSKPIRYVALICGLGFGNESQDLLSLQMFSDLVTGELGSIQVSFFLITVIPDVEC